MHTRRTRFKKDIVAEFLPPARAAALRRGRVVIVCGGMPAVPSKKSLLEFLAREGYWAFHPRYRGSWESGGEFLEHSPEIDVEDVIDALERPIVDLWSEERFSVSPREVYIIATSFGGPAGILLTRDPRVAKVVAVSPVVDWNKLGPAEPFDWVFDFTRQAFGNGYRMSRRRWNKLKNGTFYNPVAHVSTVDGDKLLIFHARDDDTVLWRDVERFAKKVGATLKLYKRGGHLGSSFLMRPAMWRQVERFFKM